MAEDILKGETCPVCGKKTLTLTESDIEVPFFGKLFVFSMICESCKYKKVDVEAAEQHEPARYTLDVNTKEDLNARVIKSSEATVKIPYIGSIEPGPASEGFVSNIEGIINKMKEQIEHWRDGEEDEAIKTKCKNMIKKLQRALGASEELKIIIEDPTGNSAIISDKAKKEKLK